MLLLILLEQDYVCIFQQITKILIDFCCLGINLISIPLFTDQKAIVTIRRTHQIKKLVYVSCDPKAALKNFVDLGRPPSKSMRGLSMVPVKAIPVDLFPHTKLCELVIYFERIDPRQPDERYTPAVNND